MNLVRIALADLRRVAKDKMAVLWLLLMPLAMAYVFGVALRGGGAQKTWIPVINLDNHELSTHFIQQLRADGYFIDVKTAEAQAELKTKWPYGVVIPPGFGDSIVRGQQVKFPLVKGDASPERLLEVQSRLLCALVRFVQGLAMADISHRPWDDEAKAAFAKELSRPQLLTVVRQSYRTLRPPPSGFSQSLPGMLVMFVMQMILTYGGTSFVVDRLGGRLRRVLATPVNRFEVYGGKIFARVLLACVQAFLLLGFGMVAFRLPLGDHPLFLLPVVLCLAAFAGAMSILAGTLCQTEKQVIIVAIFGAMILSALGGCWWPIEIVPNAFKTVAQFTPSYWAMHGLQSVLYFGRSYEVLALDCPVLLAFAVGLGMIALFLTRRNPW